MPDPSAKPTHRSFPVYDNMFYIGKPDTKQYGLIASNIIDEGLIWPHGQNYGVLPGRSAFDAIVAAHMANPGPIVLDIDTPTPARAGDPRRLDPCRRPG